MRRILLKIPYDAKGIFKNRPNRFLGIVDILKNNKPRLTSTEVHIHDPGRLQELLFPGNQVLLKRTSNPNRKTQWDLIAAKVNNMWVFTHSGYHREITEKILKDSNINPFGKLQDITPEVTIEHSRLDFLLTKSDGTKIYLEVKGCTLTQNGIALFPDAPTERGTRHLETLISLKSSNVDTAVLILVFRHDSTCFAPNRETDPKFASTLKTALEHGIKIHTIVLSYNGKQIIYEKTISICPNL